MPNSIESAQASLDAALLAGDDTRQARAALAEAAAAEAASATRAQLAAAARAERAAAAIETAAAARVSASEMAIDALLRRLAPPPFPEDLKVA